MTKNKELIGLSFGLSFFTLLIIFWLYSLFKKDLQSRK